MEILQMLIYTRLYFSSILHLCSNILSDRHASKGWIWNWTVGQVGALLVVRANFTNLGLLDAVQCLTPPVVFHSFLPLLPVLGVKCYHQHVKSGKKCVS